MDILWMAGRQTEAGTLICCVTTGRPSGLTGQHGREELEQEEGGWEFPRGTRLASLVLRREGGGAHIQNLGASAAAASHSGAITPIIVRRS